MNLWNNFMLFFTNGSFDCLPAVREDFGDHWAIYREDNCIGYSVDIRYPLYSVSF